MLGRVSSLATSLTELFSRWVQIPAPWPAALGVAIVVLALGAVVYRVVFASLARFAERTKTTLDDELVRQMRTPARILVATLGVHALLLMRGVSHPYLAKGAVLIELLLAAYLAIETAETVILHYWLGERNKVLVPAVVRHLVLVIVYAAAALSILGSVTGVDLLPVLATSTVVTVVVGLALQDTLGNLIAGLAMHAERPFSIGDWVLVDNIEGQVVGLGWRSTRLKTLTSDIVSLPNSVIAKARVQNFYAPDKVCGRNVEALVAPWASPEQVQRALDRACAKTEGILTTPRHKAWLVGFGPLFQRYVMRIWIGDFQRHDDIESDLMKALWHELAAEGIQVAPAEPAASVDPAAAMAVAALVPGATKSPRTEPDAAAT